MLLTTFVCLTFGAEQQGYSGHIEAFSIIFPPRIKDDEISETESKQGGFRQS